MGDGWSIAWRVLDAQFWGVPQRRRRIALVADFGGDTAPEILFERKSVRGYTPPSGTPWQEVAAVVAKRFNSADRKSTGAGIAYSFDSLSSNSMKSNNPNSGCRKVDIAKTIDTTIPDPSKNQGGVAIVYNGENMTNKFNAANPKPNDPCHTLNATGSNRSLCVSYSYQALGKYKESPVSSTLSARDYKSAKDLCMCVRERCGCEGGGKGCLIQNEKSGTLAVNNDQFVVGSLCARDYKGVGTQYVQENKLQVQDSAVRRLTPLECERLQGFPDGWTDIGNYTDTNGKKRKTSDTARYKALGNSIALPPWVWVLSRMSEFCKDDKNMASLFDGIGGFPLIWETLNGEGTCLWASEIEEFPIAVTKRHFS